MEEVSAHPSSMCANTPSTWSGQAGRADWSCWGPGCQTQCAERESAQEPVGPQARTTRLLQQPSEGLLDPLTQQGGGC